ncbi:MAG TPA: hypothetical protein VM598_04300 [Bdellovibrionota bacterium]|nr:hypothetical protein [Bdellovibrionota bacterium]
MKYSKHALSILIAAQLSWMGGCGGTTTGNGLVEIRVSPFDELTLFDRLIPSAYAQVTQVTFCFKRVRFKLSNTGTADPANDEDNVDFEIGEVTLSPGGTSLGNLTVPAGTYQRIEFDLEDECGTGASARVANSRSGSPFTTDSRATIRFEGTFVVDNGSERLNLGVQAIINALDGVTAGGSILRDTLESVSGSL